MVSNTKFGLSNKCAGDHSVEIIIMPCEYRFAAVIDGSLTCCSINFYKIMIPDSSTI